MCNKIPQNFNQIMQGRLINKQVCSKSIKKSYDLEIN